MHTITIVVSDNGIVQGDLDDTIELWPRCQGQGASQCIDTQVRSIVDQALEAMLVSDMRCGDRDD